MFKINKLEEILAKKAFETYYQKPETQNIIYNYLRKITGIIEMDYDILKACYHKYLSLYKDSYLKDFQSPANFHFKEGTIKKPQRTGFHIHLMLVKKHLNIGKNDEKDQFPAGEEYVSEQYVLQLPEI